MSQRVLKPNLTFSHEELVLLLYLFRSPAIPGVGAEPLAGLTEEQARLVLSSAERGLKARQIVVPDVDGKLRVERAALALIGACVVPALSVIISRTPKGSLPEFAYYHATSNLIVEHTISSPGLHTFTALADKQMWVEQITQFLKLTNQAQQTEQTAALSSDQLQQWVQTATTKPDQLIPLLQQANLSSQITNLLAVELPELVCSAGIVVIYHQPNGQINRQTGFVLMYNEQTIWQLLLPDLQNSTLLQMTSVSATDVCRQLKQLLNDPLI